MSKGVARELRSAEREIRSRSWSWRGAGGAGRVAVWGVEMLFARCFPVVKYGWLRCVLSESETLKHLDLTLACAS